MPGAGAGPDGVSGRLANRRARPNNSRPSPMAANAMLFAPVTASVLALGLRTTSASTRVGLVPGFFGVVVGGTVVVCGTVVVVWGTVVVVWGTVVVVWGIVVGGVLVGGVLVGGV